MSREEQIMQASNEAVVGIGGNDSILTKTAALWFRRGARWADKNNYVIDAIENILNADRILGNPFPTTEMRLNAIIDTIKQLKNN